MDLSKINIQELLTSLSDLAVKYGVRIVGAIFILVVGWWLIKRITKFIDSKMVKANIEVSLRTFSIDLIGVAFKILLLFTVVSTIGVEMTSFVAIFASAGLAVGMALSGTLQNFAGGVVILVFKPYKVGDFVEIAGNTGVVKNIKIFVTTVTTVDNKTIVIANNQAASGVVVNYSTEEKRRVDFLFGIAYGDDLNKAKSLIKAEVDKHEFIDKDPKPFIRLSELGDNSVNIVVRVWCNGDKYWDVYFDIMEGVYNSFNNNGINIPFPQMDVHLKQDTKNII